MKYLISVSGGAASTIAAHKAIELRGPENCVLVFADTNMEDPSLYDMVLALFTSFPEVEQIWIDNEGKDPWDIFNEAGIIKTPGNGACKASIELKIKPITELVASRWSPGEVTIVLGLEWTEEDRVARFRSRWSPYEVWCPLAEDKRYNSPCVTRDEAAELGYPVQTMYQLNYPHNNCGGACVLAGQSQWAGLLADFPERYQYSKEREEEFNSIHRSGKKPYTVHRDRRGGAFRSLSLEELESRIREEGPPKKEFRSTCSCLLGDSDGSYFSDEGGCL